MYVHMACMYTWHVCAYVWLVVWQVADHRYLMVLNTFLLAYQLIDWLNKQKIIVLLAHLYLSLYNWGSAMAIAFQIFFFRRKGTKYLKESRAGGNYKEQRLTKKHCMYLDLRATWAHTSAANCRAQFHARWIDVDSVPISIDSTLS